MMENLPKMEKWAAELLVQQMLPQSEEIFLQEIEIHQMKIMPLTVLCCLSENQELFQLLKYHFL